MYTRSRTCIQSAAESRNYVGLDCGCFSTWCRERGYLESGCLDPEYWLTFSCTRAPRGGCYWDSANYWGVIESNFVKYVGGIGFVVCLMPWPQIAHFHLSEGMVISWQPGS